MALLRISPNLRKRTDLKFLSRKKRVISCKRKKELKAGKQRVIIEKKTGWEQLKKLAIFGGSPTFENKLYVGRPNIGNREQLLNRISDIVDRKWLSNDGKYVQELEDRIAKLLGVKHCMAVCNATIGLEIVARAANLTGEVILPSFTFVATAHAMQWLGLTPVFCDIDPQTHTIDAAQIEQLITPRTSAILAVHVWGQPANVEALSAIAQRHNLKLIFDAAHAFHCSYQGRMIGNFGDAEVFSFHATKFFNTFEGGAIVTNNDDLAEKIRLMKSFGFAAGYDNVTSVGTNGKMNEACAAMGVTGLDSLNEFIEVNYRNYKRYHQELAGVPGVRLFQFDETENVQLSVHYFGD
ncbi:MAG: DegT/DnrJ/EryC1/StrS family aminotransferase [Potamolinea sp.]